tara:strand:- start:386 stop:850 length:465 start_codon:yes stop_codon:yes gene_type:complete
MQKANNTKIKTVTNFNAADNSVQLDIDLADKNYTVNAHKVESVTLYADADCAGDLAVNWEYEETDNAGYTESVMLMRNNSATDNVTETMQEFYWEHAFENTLAEILLAAGFSTEAVADVYTSEWGMQDEGRASYDAFEIAAEMLAAHNLQLENA